MKRIWIKLAMLVALVVASLGLAQTADELLNPAPSDWPTYGRTLDMTRFSPLNQINRGNASRMRLNWSRSLGYRTTAQFSPVVYKGVMYVNGPDRVAAIDATNGNLVWEYKVKLNEKAWLGIGRARGSVVVYDGKVFHNLGDGRTVALDIKTGKEVWSVQVGNVELAEGFTSGPIFANGKLIVGPSGADAGGVNGRVIALDPKDGKTLWTFNTIPKPDEPGFETWETPGAAQFGGGSAWNVGAYDSVTKTVIYGVGQPTPWYNFGFRKGDVLYTASWVALDVDSGKLKWYYQVVPGDEWDADQIPTPTITDMRIGGQNKRVAILPTTTGFLTTFDMETGKLINGWQMMPVTSIHKGFTPDGKPIIDQSMRFQASGDSRLLCSFRWVNWEPGAYSPATGLYYRPNVLDCRDLINKALPADWKPGQIALNVEFKPQLDRFPRLGGLSAIDPKTGKVAWEFTYGYANNAGPVVTGGGLVFSGFLDRVFRVFNAQTGKVLFQQVMPAYMNTAAMTYAVNGKQYVAVTVGGTSPGSAVDRQTNQPASVDGEATVFVFALP